MITQEIKELEEKLAILKEQAKNLPNNLIGSNFEFTMDVGLYGEATRGIMLQCMNSYCAPYAVFVFENERYGRNLEDAKVLAEEIIYRYNNFKE